MFYFLLLLLGALLAAAAAAEISCARSLVLGRGCDGCFGASTALWWTGGLVA